MSENNRISQNDINTYFEFTQKESINLKEEIKNLTSSARDKNDPRIVCIYSIEAFISFTSFLAKLLFRILNIASVKKQEKIQLSKGVLNRIIMLVERSPDDLLYYPVTALSSFYLEDTLEQELVISLKGSRSLYKSIKSFGKASMLKWNKTLGANNMLQEGDYEIIINQTLKAIQSVQSRNKDTATTILTIQILQKTFPYYHPDEQDQCLTLFCHRIESLSTSYSNLTPAQKSFFYNQLYTLHRLIFLTRSQISPSTTYYNPYSLTPTLPCPTLSSKFTPSLLLFQCIIHKSLCLPSPTLPIIVHRVLYPYMEILGKTKGYIEVLKDLKVVRWVNEYPEFSTKRMNLEGDEGGYEGVVREYCKDEEVVGRMSRGGLELVLGFLERVVEGVIGKEDLGMVMGVNLLEEINRKLSVGLEKRVLEEVGQANYEFLYINFMVRSYRYFKECTMELKEDDLFNKLFFKMRDVVKKEQLAKYIPDFIQVLFELLYRNTKNSHIGLEALNKIVSSV